MGTGTELHLNLTNGPIRVYADGPMDFCTGLDVYVNGTIVDDALTTAQRSLASSVLFESHDNITIPGGFLNYFFGTIFTPYGRVTAEVQDMYGSILAVGPIEAEVYLRRVLVEQPARPDALDRRFRCHGDHRRIGRNHRKRYQSTTFGFDEHRLRVEREFLG